MSLEQCNRCLYRDRLLHQGNDVYCQVHEERVPPADDCRDFEVDEDDAPDPIPTTHYPLSA